MIDLVKNSLLQQFGASINMLEKAIQLWPEGLWNTDTRFFYNAFHVIVFLDYYLTFPPSEFIPQLSFNIIDKPQAPAEAVGDVVPDRIYSMEELLRYLQFCEKKCEDLISRLTPSGLEERWVEDDGGMNYSAFEILLYNMRHVQHHTAQLNLMLRAKTNGAPGWIERKK